MAAVRVTVVGLDAAKRALRNLGASIQNPGDKLMRRLGDAMLEDTDRRFMTRGYGTWAPLAPATIRRKGHDMVLIDSGAMMSSTEIAAAGNKVTIHVRHGGRNRSAAVPSYHQNGTKRAPQRKILDVTPRLMASLGIAAAKWLAEMTTAFGKEL